MKNAIASLEYICLSLLILLPGRWVLAADAVSFYMDNDSKRLKPNHNTDRHYTAGTKLVFLTQPDWMWLEDFAHWHFGDAGQPVDTAAGFFAGQNIYTPDHADEPAKRRPEDMIFAGWLYGGLFIQRAADDKLDHIELNMGVIGPSSGAEQAQRCIHRYFHSGNPIGWEQQIPDEFAADFSYMRQQRLTKGLLAPSANMDFIADYGFTVGSVHRYVEAGLMCRYGFNIGKTFGPGRLDRPEGISLLRRTFDKSGYLYMRGAAKAVEYNRFLTGLEQEPLVGQLQAGIVLRYKKLDIGYSQSFLTKEFEEQSGKDSIGSLTLSWQF